LGKQEVVKIGHLLKDALDFRATASILRPQTRAMMVMGSKEFCGVRTMAKPAGIKIKLVSTADTGYYYVTKKNPRTMTEKMVKRKYDPVVRKHVEFKEAKIK